MSHTGSCHCGKIAFEVNADISQVIDCNCSMCAKRGGLLAFVPAAQVTLKSAESDLATYTFNTHKIQHHFCPTCGIAPFGRGTDRSGNATYAINARCLKGLDLAALDVQHYDGRST